MADAAFWEGFAKRLSGELGGWEQELRRRGEEGRAEQRQIRREERGLETYGKQLEMKEPYDKRAQERLLQRQKQLADYGMQLDMQREQNKTEYRAKLEGAYNDPALLKMKEKAAKGTDPKEQAYMMLLDKEMAATARGEADFDPIVAEGLPPLARQRYNQAILENTIRERDYVMAKDQLKRQMLALKEQIAYHQTLQQQREDVGLTREINRAQDLEKPIAQAQEGFIEIKRTLMNDLTTQKIINKKGEVTKGGKNLQLYNPETKEFNEDAKARLLQYYPHYQLYFENLDAIQAQLTIYEDMKERFKEEGGEAKTWTGSDGKTYEVGKTYTLGGQKVKCIGENQFEPVK